MRSSAQRKIDDFAEPSTHAEDQSNAFARELTDLSHKYGLGIAGAPDVFVFEGAEDRTLSYEVDDAGRLQIIST
ncbi:hypothetical protein [Nitratireductor sp. StC3]|uniref:hypothetical protein n=1 Tax=Nitratireductor sp. StC3 TaxID=2126741 RepID=UPI000D0DB42B|nr:hypothetical protein [Nitratireductor sp. StC3]